MDPNETLRIIASAKRATSAQCRNALADLASWIGGGGFAPDWRRYPLGARRFARWHPGIWDAYIAGIMGRLA